MTTIDHWLQPGDLIPLLKLKRGSAVAVLESEPGYYGKHVEAELGSPVAETLSTFPPGSCRCIILADVLHQTSHQKSLLDQAKRALAEDGRLVVFDPYPTPDRKILQDTLCLVERASWTLEKMHSRWNEGFVMVFEPTDESVQS